MSSCFFALPMKSVRIAARRLGAHDQAVVPGRIGLARAVGIEQRGGLFHEPLVLGGDAEAAALLDIELRVVEAVDVQPVVGEHHLAVIPRQVVGGASHGDPRLEHPRFQLAEDLLAAAVGVRDQRPDRDAARHRRLERFLELGAIEPEDHDVDGFAGVSDRLQHRSEAVVRLDDELHFPLFFFSAQSTAPWPSGSRRRMALVRRSVCNSNGTWTS